MATAEEKAEAQRAYEQLERKAAAARTEAEKRAVIDAILDQGNKLKGLSR